MEKIQEADLDSLNYVDDFSEASLRALGERIERSRTLEQLIYRESELDEVWRLVDCAILDVRRQDNNPDKVEILMSLRDAVMKVHDLVGVDEDVKTAASELRSAVFLAMKYTNLQE